MPRKVMLALTLACVAIGAGACAKPADESRLPAHIVTVADVRAAPDTLASAGSGRFEVRLGAAAAPGDVVATGGFSDHKVRVELDLASVLARAATATPGASVPSGVDTTMRVVIDGTSVYLQAPMLQGISGASGWLSLSAADLGSVGDSLGMQGAAFDPSKVLEVLRGAADGMQVVSADVVRGVATTHVRATVPAGAAAVDPSHATADVWIDRQGLVRRIQMAADGISASAPDPGAIVTIELFDYGQPIEITVPTASEVVPFSELFGLFAGAGI